MTSVVLHEALYAPPPDEAAVMAGWPGGAPKVSVLCHAYQQAGFLPAALDSVLRQRTSFPFEVIVRDDGSSDGTAQIVAEYARRYPRIVRPVLEPRNRYRDGVKPLSATFPLARGEYVAFCEGDDLWLGTGKLARQVDRLEGDPACGLVHGNYLNLVWIGGTWKVRRALRATRAVRERDGHLFPAMLGRNLVQTCTVACRRELVADYRANGPGVDAYRVGDWPLFLYIAGRGRVRFDPSPVAAYRRTPGSVVNSGAGAAVARAIDAVGMAGDFARHFAREDLLDEALPHLHSTVLRLAFDAGDPGAFSDAWTWLARHRPERVRGPVPRAMRALLAHPRARATVVRARAAAEAAKHGLEFRRPVRRDR